jgi:hypothetical protein
MKGSLDLLRRNGLLDAQSALAATTTRPPDAPETGENGRPPLRAGRGRAAVDLVVRWLARSPLGTPRVAISLSAAGLLLLVIVGATAPNANTLSVRLPLAVLPSVPWQVSYPMTVMAVALECVGLAGMLWANSRGWSPDPRRLFMISAAFVLVIVNLTPVGSSDTASYAAYGRLAALGYDPYTTLPTRLGSHDPYFTLISSSWQTTPSVYGPVATWVQAIAAHIGGARPWVTIWMLLILNGIVFLAVGYLLLRTSDDPVRATLLWAANPLMLQQLVTGGHLDTLIAAGTICALQLTRRGGSLPRDLIAGVVLGLTAGIKIDAGLIAVGVAWPLLRRHEWRRVARISVTGLVALLGVYSAYGIHALGPLSSASKLVAVPTIWTIPWNVGKNIIGASTTIAIISVLWPIVLVWLAWFLARRVDDTGYEQATCSALLMIAWIAAAPWAMPWYAAPGWAAVTQLPRNPLTRWLAVLTSILAMIHSSGGHQW